MFTKFVCKFRKIKKTMEEQLISFKTAKLAKKKGCILTRCICGGYPDCICGESTKDRIT